MLRAPLVACLLGVLLATTSARAAEESSSEDAPFAGTSKGPAPFAASPSAGFAAMDQWVLTLRTTPDAGGFLFFHKNSPGDWELSLHPAIDYFITSSVSLGAVVGYRHSSAATGTTALGLGARAGFNLNINDHVGVWPTAGLAVNYVSANHESSTTTTFGIFAPFLYHLVPHLFVGLGPSFSILLSGADGKSYGLDFVLGGWL
jgi:hypothetical protein